MLFMVIRQYGTPCDAGKPLESQRGWEDHRIFMNSIEAQGLVRLAGPLERTDQVLLIVRADNAAEIDHRLAADPWTKSGILATTRIVRWDLRVGEVG